MSLVNYLVHNFPHVSKLLYTGEECEIINDEERLFVDLAIEHYY